LVQRQYTPGIDIVGTSDPALSLVDVHGSHGRTKHQPPGIDMLRPDGHLEGQAAGRHVAVARYFGGLYVRLLVLQSELFSWAVAHYLGSLYVRLLVLH
jgi:hypothetical protein